MDRRRQAAPQVYEQLREQILSLALEPGAVLSRAELAARFGVSQTPVREALIHLGEEGLVDVFPQHATVVSPIDIPAALQSHFLRRAIELELVRELVTRPDAELKALLLRLRSHVSPAVPQLSSTVLGTIVCAKLVAGLRVETVTGLFPAT